MKKIITVFILFYIANGTIQAQIQDTFLVKPYLQYGTKNGMYVLWETNGPTTGQVEYTKAKLGTETIEFDHKILSKDAKQLHEIAIDNLEVNTKYIYRVTFFDASGNKLEGEVSTFKTAVNDDDSYKFVLIGDIQRNSRTPWAWGKIAQRAWEERPDFLVLAGDLVDKGSRKSDWTEDFFPSGNVVMKRYPIYSVLGNHEQDSPNYYAYMVNPEPEYYYSFTYGNAEFFMIDTNREVDEDSEQYNWLEWALAASKARWKFVIHHHPPYSSDSNDHGETSIGLSTNGTKARNLVPLLEKYGVDFCMFGHTHLYERTFPLFQNRINMNNGVVYINSGGAGGGLEDFDPVRNWFTSELRSTHHFCTFTVFEDQIEFKAIDHEGRVFDSYIFKKPENKMVTASPPAPRFNTTEPVFEHSGQFALNAMDPAFQIRYTTDGSDPSFESTLYTAPVEIQKSTVVKAACFDQKGERSRVVSLQMKQMPPKPATKLKADQSSGINYTYYEGKWKSLPDFKSIDVVSSGSTKLIGLDEIKHREDHFAVVFEGYIKMDETGTYTFYTYSDDGSRLFIDDELLIDADGDHSLTYYYGSTILEAGYHKIRVEYFEASGSESLSVGTLDKNGEKIPIRPFQLKRAVNK